MSEVFVISDEFRVRTVQSKNRTNVVTCTGEISSLFKK